MAGQNEVSQVVRLDGNQYRSEIGRMQSETRSNLQRIGKDLTDAGRGYQDFTNNVKKQTGSMIGTIEEAGRSFAKNLGRGALAGGALAGIETMRAGAKASLQTIVSFDEALARVASRADLSSKQVAKLKQEFLDLGKTGARLETIPAAFDAIYGATGNVDQSSSVMGSIAKAGAMNGGDAGEVAEFVKDRLKGEGKEINPGNVQALLHSLTLAQRGGEFNSLSDAMKGMGGVNAADQKRAGLSDRELAGILAGSTRAGADKATGVAAAQALVHMSQKGFGGSAALSGLLGASFTRGGKFDPASLNQAAANQRRSGRSDSESVALFQSAGLSEQESSGLLAILKNVEKFQEGVKRVQGDTKTFEQSFQETTDTLSHNLERLKNTVVSGFDDIFSPLAGVANKALKGDTRGALGAMPGAFANTMDGVADHPFLVGGGLLATAAGGAVLKKFGLGGSAAGLASGVAKGRALQGAGVTPVYVTTAGEIAGSGGSMADDFMKKMSEMAAGGGGAVVGSGRLASVLGIARTAAGSAASLGAGALGAGLPGVLQAGDKVMQNIGNPEKFNAQVMEVYRNMEAMFARFFGDGKQTVKVEVDSKDAAYMARPKKTDHPRDPRGA